MIFCIKSVNMRNLSSGTFTLPMFGSIVQKGKLADCALELDKQLNNVDFPTLGKPIIPAFIKITYLPCIKDCFSRSFDSLSMLFSSGMQQSTGHTAAH